MSDADPGVIPTIYTVGHSNHPWDAFVGLLHLHGIRTLVDVRSSPYSAYATQYHREQMISALPAEGVAYVFLGDQLGGRPEDPQFYDEGGAVCYDRLAASKAFRGGLGRLAALAAQGRIALMCGEEDPTNCHRRRLICRVLAAQGTAVIHVRGDGRAQEEQEVAREEQFQKTKGQKTLFELEDPEAWKSSPSVSRRKPPASSSKR